jgi:TonB family protein
MSTLILKAVALSAAMGIILSASAIAKPAAKAAAPAKSASNAALQSAFNAYLDNVRNKIDKNWYVADGKNHVTLTMDLSADGSVTNLNITSSPSNTTAEQAASDAFNQAQPLGALPGGTQQIKLTLTFDSTADPHGDSNRSIGAKVDVPPPAAKPAESAPSTESTPSTSEPGGN